MELILVALWLVLIIALESKKVDKDSGYFKEFLDSADESTDVI